MKWKRICPNCKEELFYSTKGNRDNAEKLNRICHSCAMRSEKTRKRISESCKGQKRSEETRKRISKSKKGKNNPAKRPEVRKKLKESKMGDNNPAKRSEVRKKISESKKGKLGYWKGKKRSEKVKLKMRLSRLKNIEKNNGQVIPNHNPDGCEIIRWYNMYYGFNFQHAENGGEVCIGGYWPDGLDEKRKTIIEIDEKKHFNSDGKLKQKDIQRQKYLEGLGYTFIRVRV